MIMKIKITETQANRIGLLMEAVDPLAKLENYSKMKSDTINSIYNNVTSASIMDVINNQINFSQYIEILDDIEQTTNMLSDKAYQYIDELPDEGLDVRIDNAHDAIDKKIDVLKVLLINLHDIQNLGTRDVFHDNQPLDIG